MPNPVYKRFNCGNGFGPFGKIVNIEEKYRQFESNFKGDPYQQVQNMLNSGQMSQEQFNYFSNLATHFRETFKHLFNR